MKTILVLILLAAAAFVAWPYYHVWELDRAVAKNDAVALNRLVDIAAVREEIKGRLERDMNRAVGGHSEGFLGWLQNGVRRMGTDAIESMITIPWVRDQLQAKNRPGDPPGYWHNMSYAFFDSPTTFLVRIGKLGDDPVHAELSLQGIDWRLTALYN
ncbi:MAG: DUF2939 domain-containing protein [Pseudomonadota bacterium]